MSLIRWTPMSSLLNRWPDVWDEDDMADIIRSTTHNNLDVYETENEVVVKANVAGVDPTKVDVTFEKGILWIKGEAQKEEKDEKKKHYSKSSWNYSYRVAVPGMLDYTQEPAAEVHQGVITVTFKKAEASKPKKLQVKAKAS